MKKILFFFFLTFTISLFFALQKAYVKEFVPFNLKQALLQKVNQTSLEQKIKKALLNDNPKEAKEYLELAKFLQIPIDNNLTKQVTNANSTFNLYKSKTKHFFQGFISGKASDSASLGGVVVSDFTVIGDLRDIYHEGKKMNEGKKYDKFTLYLSIVGVALSISALASFGSSLALKSESSLLKNAYKMHFLTKSFQKEIIKRLEQSIDAKAIEKLSFNSLNSVKKDILLLKKSIHPKPMQTLLQELHTLQKYSGSYGTLLILRNIKNEKELQKAIKLSKKYKKLTPTIFKILGREALRSGKWVLKKASYYSYLFLGFIVLLFATLLSFITLLKKSYSLFS